MGHYDDMDEAIEAKNRENDNIIFKLSDDQKASVILKSKINDLKRELKRLSMNLKEAEKRLKKLKVKPPDLKHSTIRRIGEYHFTRTIKNYVYGKGWDKDTGWF